MVPPAAGVGVALADTFGVVPADGTVLDAPLPEPPPPQALTNTGMATANIIVRFIGAAVPESLRRYDRGN